MEAERAARKKRSKDALEAQIENMTVLHDHLLERGNQGIDIEGRWQMNCPDITLGWRHNEQDEHEEMFWNIHRLNQMRIVVGSSSSRSSLTTFFALRWEHQLSWRGRETGESGLEFDDEVNSGYIVFSSSHECSGMFGSTIGGPWAFTGMKIDKAVPTSKRQKTLKKEYENYERRFYKEGFFL
jgi:hypothetical protein